MELSRIEKTSQLTDLSSLAKEIWTECYSEILSQGQIIYMTEKFLSKEALEVQIQNGYDYYFITENGEIHGFVGFKAEDGSLFLSKLYLKKFCRKKGYGKKVFSFLENYCRDNSLSHIWLTVNVNNSNAIEMYKKSGFYITESKCVDIGNGYVMDDHYMRKDI